MKEEFEDVKFGCRLPPHTPDSFFVIAARAYFEENELDSVFVANQLVDIAVRRFDLTLGISSALVVKTCTQNFHVFVT